MAGRRAGYAYQRGPYWTIRYDAPTVPGEKRRQVRESGRWTTKREAEKVLRLRLAEIENGTWVDPAAPPAPVPTGNTLAEYLQGRWLPHMRHHLAASTFAEYSRSVAQHLVPEFGMHPLPALTAIQVQEWVDKLAGRLAPKTVRNHYNVLHRALKQAVTWGLLTTNPADGATPPRNRMREIVVPEMSIPRRALAGLQGTQWYLPVALVLATGLRRSEVLALQWRDVEGDCLLVRRARVRVTGSGSREEVDEKEPKNGRSRTVALPPALVRLLRRHRRHEPGGPTDYICSDPVGEPLLPGGLSLAYRRAAHAVDPAAPGSIHGLRHLQAVSLLEAGVPDKVTSERLGHSVQVLGARYQHVHRHLQVEAADIAGKAWKKKS